MFAVPFEDIAPIVERSPEATRQLASRARRRVRGAAPVPDPDIDAQWEVVEAFLAAARGGDFDALVAVLDPDVELRADGGLEGITQHIRGAETVASQALTFRRFNLTMRRALVNGAAGMVSFMDGKPFSLCALTIKDGRIAKMNFLTDPERLAAIDFAVLEG
jgi:RNA polymerase sigma-70 factor (ECF subfamily)